MKNYKEVKGNLITLALKGEFHAIAHGCNCFCTMGAGIAVEMAHHFDCNNPEIYNLESPELSGNINKLGMIQANAFRVKNIHFEGVVAIINAYTQYGFGKNHSDSTKAPLDYEALTLCLRKINHDFRDLEIGLPQIGCGLAGGDWKKVKKIIKKELKDCYVTVVIYEP